MTKQTLPWLYGRSHWLRRKPGDSLTKAVMMNESAKQQISAISPSLPRVRDQDGVGGGLPHGRASGGASTQGDSAPSVMTFKDVKDLADSQRGLELPGFSPYSAVQTLISRSSRGWAGAYT
eukprot:scaffold49004_cov19-Tisochrysis_lutea.AAC.4